MLQELVVIACRMVGPLVRSTRLGPGQGTVSYGLPDVDHRVQLESGNQLGVERLASVGENQLLVPLPQVGDDVTRPLQGLLVPKYPRSFFETLLEVGEYAR